MRHQLALKPLIVIVAGLLLVACASSPPTPTVRTGGLPNGHTALHGITTSGQPSPQQLEQAHQAGYATVINLRTSGEQGSWDEAAKAAELGLAYVHLPIAGAAGVTEANARALGKALASAQRPVLLHCSSGNRAGALLALKAHFVDGKSKDDALKLGRDSGVTQLEPALKKALGLGD